MTLKYIFKLSHSKSRKIHFVATSLNARLASLKIRCDRSKTNSRRLKRFKRFVLWYMMWPECFCKQILYRLSRHLRGIDKERQEMVVNFSFQETKWGSKDLFRLGKKMFLVDLDWNCFEKKLKNVFCRCQCRSLVVHLPVYEGNVAFISLFWKFQLKF